MFLEGSSQGSCDSYHFQEGELTHETGYAVNSQMRNRCGLFRLTTTTNGQSCFGLHVLLQPIRKLPVLAGKMNTGMICVFQCAFP